MNAKKSVTSLFVFLIFIISGCTSPERTHQMIFRNLEPQKSFVKIFTAHLNVDVDSNGNASMLPSIGVASGFLLRNDNQNAKQSLVITAAHVCTRSPKISIVVKIDVQDFNGKIRRASIFAVDLKNDLCALSIEKKSDAMGLEISSFDPLYGQRVKSLGAPSGIFFPSRGLNLGMVPLFDGYFCGASQSDEFSVRSFFSVPASPGSSGGPILNENNEIVGMTSMVPEEFNHLTISPRLFEIRSFARTIRQ